MEGSFTSTTTLTARARRFVLALLGCAVLALAGCGGNSDDSPFLSQYGCGTTIHVAHADLTVNDGDAIDVSISFDDPLGTSARNAQRIVLQWYRLSPGGTWTAHRGPIVMPLDIDEFTRPTMHDAPAVFGRDNGAKYKAQVTYTCATGDHFAESESTTVQVTPAATRWVNVDGQGQPVDPSDVSVAVGATANFAAMAYGNNVYQWQRSPDGGTTWADLPGMTDWTLTVGPVQAGDDGTLFRLLAHDASAAAPIVSRAARLTVTSLPPTYDATLAAATLAVDAGGQGTVDFTVTPANGFTGMVAVGATGLPAGVTVSPTSLAVAGAGAVTQTLTFTVPANTPAGDYAGTITASSGAIQKQLALDFVVRAPAATCVGAGTVHAAPIVASESWSAAGSPHHVPAQLIVSGGVLSIQAGARVCLGFGASLVFSGARLSAQGTAAEPIVFTAEDPAHPWGALSFGGNVTFPGGSELTYVQITNAMGPIYSGASHPITMNRAVISQLTNSALDLRAWGSVVNETTIDGAGATANPLVSISGANIAFSARVRNAAIGIQIGDNGFANLSNCEVSNTTVTGIYVVTPDGVSISDCNLINNQSFAIQSNTASPLDATRNWWGTPAGAATAGPNRVSSGINTANPQTAPVPLSY